MARASALTNVPLDTWARIMGVSPWEFNQIGVNLPTAADNTCDSVFFQHPWQYGFISREEVGKALFMAEQAIADEAGFFVAPTQCSDVVINTRFGAEYRTNANSWPGTLNWKQVRSPGIIVYQAIAKNVVVTYADTTGDGVNDSFVVVTPTTVTDPDEIVLIFNETDRHNVDPDQSWEIRPVRATISGGTVAVTGHASLLVYPDHTENVAPVVLDVTDPNTYVVSVDVYRKYIDYSATADAPYQGHAIWDGSQCSTTGDSVCAITYAPICVQYGYADMGVVSIKLSQNCTHPSRAPDRFQVNYVSGIPLYNGTVHPRYADIVVHLATALLPAEPCGCDRTNKIVEYWRSEAQTITPSAYKCPFGTTRGAVYAWQRLQPLIRMGAVSI